jgi:hypothetical protein
MQIVTDPLFYLLAIPAVLALGLGKGGFAGVGMISTPLLALLLPPLQAAAILLPILVVQDVISVWAYRHEWSAWNLKVPDRWSVHRCRSGMAPGSLRHGRGNSTRGRHHRCVLRALRLVRPDASGGAAA